MHLARNRARAGFKIAEQHRRGIAVPSPACATVQSHLFLLDS